jgi:hypothetical protein
MPRLRQNEREQAVEMLLAGMAQTQIANHSNFFFCGAEIFNPQKENPQKINVFFLVQNRRNFTPQKLPVVRYIL